MTGSLLQLYIAGNSTSSRRAEQNLDRLRALLKTDTWTVEVIDVLANPERAEQAAILATPTLSYEHSGRARRIVGDLSDTKKSWNSSGSSRKEAVHDVAGFRRHRCT